MNTKGKVTLVILGLITFSALMLAIFMPFNSKLSNLDFYIFDTNDNYHYEVNEKLEFFVNDTLAVKSRKLIWHFGNGDTLSRNKNITYKYRSAGKYLITLDVDSKYKISKYIKVVSIEEKMAYDSIPKIHGVDKAVIGEELVFSSEGPGIDTWYWEFGETGTVDAYDQRTVYTYTEPGSYKVKLKTNTSQYPIIHEIEVMPRFEKIEELVAEDSLSLAGNDIKKRLQKIANSKVSNEDAFYNNLNYIVDQYTCGKADEVVVVINESKYNELYSYCQGLHYLDSKKRKTVTINKVELDTFNCIKKIKVTQSILE